MRYVKLTHAIDVYGEGEVISVDEGSAAALIDRGAATPFEPGDGEDEPALQRPAKPGHVVTQQVVEADPYPSTPVTVAELPADATREQLDAAAIAAGHNPDEVHALPNKDAVRDLLAGSSPAD